MTDQRNNDLKYGHLGECAYDPDSRSWHWRRSSGTRYALQRLGHATLAVEPVDFSHDAADKYNLDGHKPPGLPKGQRALGSKHVPISLTTSGDLLHSLANISGQVIEESTRYDPAVGDLLAFGRVRDLDYRRTASICAFPGDGSRMRLRLAQIQPQRQGWEKNKSVWIEVPQISGEPAFWNPGGPIQQIRFAELPEGRSAPLAVRTLKATSILQPHIRRGPAGEPRTAVLNPNPSCTISGRSTGGFSHADVSFNPWYQQQFAIVDQTGTWTVWELTQKREGRKHLPRNVARSSLREVDGDTRTKLLSPIPDDGWARIVWAGDLSTIVVCSRRSLALFDFKSNPVRLLDPDLGLTGTPHWILGLQSHPVDRGQFLVLTSTHLLLMRARCLDRSDDESWRTAGAVVVLRCTHFLDPEDVSLRLSCYVDKEGKL